MARSRTANCDHGAARVRRTAAVRPWVIVARADSNTPARTGFGIYTSSIAEQRLYAEGVSLISPGSPLRRTLGHPVNPRHPATLRVSAELPCLANPGCA